MVWQSLLDKIAAVEKTTTMERRLALFFERDLASLVFEDLDGISRKTGISQSTISRFIAKLGYANFRAFSGEMRQLAASSLDTPVKRHALRASIPSAAEGVLAQHMNNVCGLMQSSLETLREEDFLAALDLLCDERRHLFLLGSVVSEHVLSGFSILLRYVRSNFTQLKIDASTIARQIADMPPDSVLLVLGNKRYSVTTGKVLRHFYQNGHTTIVITDSYASPFYRMASVPLVILREGSSTFHTRCTAMALLEAFISGMTLRCKDSFPERFERVTDLLDEFGVFLAK